MWRLIPMLLLTAVTLSTGVLLPRLPPLHQGSDSAADQTSRDTHSTQTECGVLRRLFNSDANWIFDTDNKQYNDYVTKRRGANLQDDNFGRVRYNYQYQPRDFENYFHKQNPNERLRYEMSLPTTKTWYLRNKDVLIQDDQAYYMYDTYMATTSPFDYIQNQHNCLYKAMSRPSSPNKASTDAEILKWLAENEKLNTNELFPSIEQMAKRVDTEEAGEKEIPDLLISDGETGEVQKKLFSFWSRLQALSHKGRQLPTRRHTFAFYGPDGTRDGPLTAETRASHLRPPGQPLRYVPDNYSPYLLDVKGEKTVLYAFWASSCSWRVRAALVAKRQSFEERTIDIVKRKDQKTEAYRAICPSQKVPALVIDGVTLTESMAILQYLEDTRPHPSLAPSSPLLRARVREIVETVVAGIQPLQNVGLRASFEEDSQYTQFGRHWTMRGLETLEELLSRTARDRMYCVGDQLTFADLCLVPQVYNAVGRHKININKYPTVAKLYEALLKDDVFATTHPEKVKSTQ